MPELPGLGFAGLLRQLRAAARLTQEELAAAARLSPRSVSDLERGINRTARKDTALLLADALALTGPPRELFVAAARGRAPVAEVLAALSASRSGARTGPHERGLIAKIAARNDDGAGRRRPARVSRAPDPRHDTPVITKAVGQGVRRRQSRAVITDRGVI